MEEAAVWVLEELRAKVRQGMVARAGVGGRRVRRGAAEVNRRRAMLRDGEEEIASTRE